MEFTLSADFHNQYKKVLTDCLTLGCDEGSLAVAYELGQRAYGQGASVEELLKLHHNVLSQLFSSLRLDPKTSLVVAGEVAVEFFAPIQGEISRLRNYQVAQDNLTARLRQQARVLDRANEALKAATSRAEAATMAKAEFLAHMSHEIRTPLNAIIGMSGLLMETELGGQQRDFAETIRASGDHLLTIINDILDFSKIEAGKLEMEVSSFRLSQCIEDCLDLVSARAAEKAIDIGYFIEPGVPRWMQSDIGRIRQVLLNLLSNAVKFTNKGEVSVYVRARPFEEPNQYEVHFAIRDTGTGIAKEQQGRLFQAFSQLDPSTTRVYGGTGLGLSISRRLVELLGGSLWVESEPGLGSTFHFTIRTTVDDSTQLHGNSPNDNDRSLQGRRILIVDANSASRRILAAYIRMWNMTPVEAATPTDALMILSDVNEISLVLVEYELPEMTGVELATRIRQMPGHAQVPMILFSSATRKPGEVTSAGFRCFLTKPLKPSTLHNVVIDALAKQQTEVQAPVVATDEPVGQSHPLRILVAEDNSVNQKVAAAILARLGYTADIVANGREAVTAVQMKPYDVVLMDVQMPEMDGLQATQELCRRLTPMQRPHIVALTANVTEEVRRQCLAAGMDSYISKPVTISKLSELLRRCTPRPTSAVMDAADNPSIIATRPERPLKIEEAQLFFWRAQAEQRGLDLDVLTTRVGEETLKLRRAADLGDHKSGRSSAQALRRLLLGGVPATIIKKFIEIDEMSAEAFLREGIAAVASIQLEMENVQATIRSAKSLPMSRPDRIGHIEAKDIERLVEELGGATVVVAIVDEFLGEAQKLVQEIGSSILRHESGDVRRAAHALKGACSILPLPQFTAAAEAIECATQEGHIDRMADLWSNLADEHARGVAMLLESVEALRVQS